MAAPLFGLPDSNTAAALVTRFVALSDVPASYAGQALKGVRVNAGETGLEFAAIVTTFVALTDGPGAFGGNALKAVRVNAGATALEYFTVSLSFIGLTDVPASYSGAGLKYVRVNAGATALEFQTFPTLVTAFTGLSDVPASYSGQALKGVRVNAGATALEFYTQAFIGLSDVPASFSGAGLKRVRVNSGATALEFITDAFTNLSDVPTSYSGQSGKLVRVNSGETALEFATVSAGIGNSITFADTTASTPAAGNSTLYSLKAGVSRLAFIQPDARRYPVQPAIPFIQKWEYLPQKTVTFAGTAATSDAFIGSISMANAGPGTGTAAFTTGLASTNVRTASVAVRRTGATADSSVSNIFCDDPFVWMGNAAGRGGFYYHTRIGLHIPGGSVATNFKCFFGLAASTTSPAGTTAPQDRLNCIGFGCEAADTNLSVYHNDGSGTATKIALGSTYPARTTTALYDFYLFCAPNSTTIEYYIVRVDTGDITSGSFSTDIPSSTTFLGPHFWTCNGASAGAVAGTYDMMKAYIEHNP